MKVGKIRISSVLMIAAFVLIIMAAAVGCGPSASVTGIELVTTNAKMTYYVGEDYSKEGLVVNLVYSDDTKKATEDFTVENFDSSTAGTKTLTVKSGEFSAAYDVEVLSNEDYVAFVVEQASAFVLNPDFANLDVYAAQEAIASLTENMVTNHVEPTIELKETIETFSIKNPAGENMVAVNGDFLYISNLSDYSPDLENSELWIDMNNLILYRHNVENNLSQEYVKAVMPEGTTLYDLFDLNITPNDHGNLKATLYSYYNPNFMFITMVNRFAEMMDGDVSDTIQITSTADTVTITMNVTDEERTFVFDSSSWKLLQMIRDYSDTDSYSNIQFDTNVQIVLPDVNWEESV